MYSSERFHRYPRQITASITLLCVLLVVVPVANLGAAVLRGLWDIYGRDDSLLGRMTFLSPVIAWIDGGPRVRADGWFPGRCPACGGSLPEWSVIETPVEHHA